MSHVNVRLVPRDPNSNGSGSSSSAANPGGGSKPAAKNYKLVKVNGVTYLMTHQSNGQRMAHEENQWNAHGTTMQTLLTQMSGDNPEDFRPESSVHIDLNQGKLSCARPLTDKEERAIPKVVTAASQQLISSLCTLKGQGTILPPPPSVRRINGRFVLVHETILGTKSQETNTCVGTSLTALMNHFENSEISAAWVDRTVDEGAAAYREIIAVQEQVAAGLPGASANSALIAAGGIDLPRFFPTLIKTDLRINHAGGQTPKIPQNAEPFYRDLLKQVADSSPQDQVGAVITVRGFSIAVAVTKNGEGQIKEVLYFDSHRAIENDSNNMACVKRFTAQNGMSAQEIAAAFLAHRFPHQSTEHVAKDNPNGDPNEISIVGVEREPCLHRFFELLALAKHKGGDAKVELMKHLPQLMQRYPRAFTAIQTLCDNEMDMDKVLALEPPAILQAITETEILLEHAPPVPAEDLAVPRAVLEECPQAILVDR